MFKDMKLTFIIIVTMFFNEMIWFFHSLATQIVAYPSPKQLLFFTLYALMAYGVLKKAKWSYFICLAYSLYILTVNSVGLFTNGIDDFMTPMRLSTILLNLLLPLSILEELKFSKITAKVRSR